ncbi:InlB B-repeat-containing protein, partial [Agathobaculum sp. TL06]
MKKRLLAILLTALMVVGMVPLQAAAAGPQDQTALPSDGGELTSGSYYLAADTQLTADLVIPEDAKVALELNGHTLTGSGSGSVITVAEGASLSITDSSTAGTGVITGGKSSSGGAIANQGTLSMTGGTVSGNEATNAGGAIYTTGDMTLQNVTIRDNKTTGDNSTGGGISISEDASSTLNIAITSCVVEGNTSHMKGGGLDYLSQNNTSTSEITIAGTVFRANEASGTDLPDGTKAAGVGGGASLMGVVTLSDCQFFENTARSGGGLSISGLSDNEGDITIENCVFQENAAATGSQPTEIPDTEGETVPTTGMGGGIYSQMGNFTIKGGSVTNNTAALGGGVCAAVAGVTLADGGVICNNTAEEGGDDFCFLYTFGVYTSQHSLTLPSPASFDIDGVQQWFEDAPDMRYKEDMTGVAKYDGFTNETADHYLSAGQVFTVTFDSNGGSYVAPVFAAPNKTIDQPQDPTYTGYIFQGWQTQAGDSFDFETAITEDMTLVAQWETDPAYALFTLTYANTDIPPEEVRNGTTVTLADRTPTKEGFDFAGWYADKELTTPITSVYMDGPKTVYAKWTEKVVPGITIHFETYGGTPVEDIFISWEDFQEAYEDDDDALNTFLSALPTAEDPEKEGYEFLWWTYNYADELLRMFQTSPSETVRESYEETKALLEKEIAEFESQADKLWSQYQNDTLEQDIQEFLENFDYENSPFKDEETIVKLWVENLRNTYNDIIATGTASSDTPTLVSFTIDEFYELQESMTGNRFVLSVGNLPFPGEQWAFGLPLECYYQGHDVTVTLRAKYWNPETGEIATPYTLTYDANGGQNAPASVQLVPGAATLSEQAPTREGYTFAGWNTQQDGSGTTYQAGGAFTMPKEDVTLYAQWAAGTVTLTPQDMTAYTGGDSISDDPFPSVRYAITGVESTAIPDLEFTVGGNTCKPKQAGSYWLLSGVENTFTPVVSQKTRAAGEYENDGLAGEYTIGVENDDTLTVKGADDKQYAVKVADGEEAGILTVRNVSDPNAVLEDKMDIAQEVVSSESQVDTSKGAVAVIENGATYYTNGKKANLGVLGTSSAAPTSGE